MTRRKTRKKPTFLALPVKIQALAEVYSGATIAGTARKYGVTPPTIAKWKATGLRWQKDGKPVPSNITVNKTVTKTKTNGKLMNVDTYNRKRYTSSPKITHYNPSSTTELKTNIGAKINSVDITVNGKNMTLTPNDIRDISALKVSL